ncbi:MAG TPA: glycosyltransferase [Chthoniobacterales bacterium]|jgi:colanic acid/amylovoran biosynthesis glycosyltransferase
MRIAVVVSGFPIPSETFILRQIIDLIGCGHEVDVFADTLIRENVATLGVGADVIVRVKPSWFLPRPFSPRKSIRKAARGLYRRLSHLQSFGYHRAFGLIMHERAYDIIHAHFGPNGQRAVRARQFRKLKGKIVTTFHGYDVNLLPRELGTDLYRDLFLHGDVFTVGSQFMRKQIEQLGAPVDRVIEIPMGVPINEYQPGTKVRSNVLNIITIARLVEVKGIRYLLQAISLATNAGIKVRCVIAGDGPLRSTLMAYADTLGITELIEFTGAVSACRTRELFKEADVFVLPSIVTGNGEQESQGLAVAEAQACGLPVITTETGGLPESIRPNCSGVLVAPANAHQLATAIQHMASNRNQAENMGRSGRRYVEERFSFTQQQNKFSELYKWLLRDN